MCHSSRWLSAWARWGSSQSSGPTCKDGEIEFGLRGCARAGASAAWQVRSNYAFKRTAGTGHGVSCDSFGPLPLNAALGIIWRLYVNRLALLLIATSVLFGCMSIPERSRSEPFAFMPSCKTTGCVERDPYLTPPPGARLSFSQCAGDVTQSFVYTRDQQGWVLVEYSATIDGPCEE